MAEPRDVALAYAAAGLPVFPCAADKRPLTSHGFKNASVDPAQIADWWKRWPDARVAMPTGKSSGIFAVDLDVDRETGEAIGETSLHEAGLLHIIDDRAITTPSGGKHIFFRHVDGLRNTAGKIGRGVDTRGSGGYICIYDPVPPNAANLPDLPPELRRALRGNLADIAFDDPPARPAAYGQAALAGELAKLLSAPQGQRNSTLNEVAFRLGQLVSCGDLDREAVYQRLMAAALAIGLADGEAAATITSGLGAGAQSPRTNAAPPSTGAAPATGSPASAPSHAPGIASPVEPFTATPFEWIDPASLPARRWLYGRHLIRGFSSTTLAAGGVGKTSLIAAEAIAMASGRDLLGEWVAGPLRVWMLNLEDPAEELQRRVTAAMIHHGVSPEDLGGRLFVDSGRRRGLCVAVQDRGGVIIQRPEIDALEAEIRARQIDVLSVDPFVSSHRVAENDNTAIDAVAKEWSALAERCSIAVELVHHVRKTNGEEATSEAGRGASALLFAARSSRVLNRMSEEQKISWGFAPGDPTTLFSVDRDKANLAPLGKRVWRRMATVELANGDSVGVAEAWSPPDDFDGVDTSDLIAVQRAVAAACEAGNHPRASVQAKGWIGALVADVLGLDPEADRKRINRMVMKWTKTGALREITIEDEKRKPRPCLEVGEWASE